MSKSGNSNFNDTGCPRALLAAFDDQRKKRGKFEKIHTRQTFWIETELVRELNELCKARPGFKTQFVNAALRSYLVALKTETSDVAAEEQPEEATNEFQTVSSSAQEMKRREFEEMLSSEAEVVRNKARSVFFPDHPGAITSEDSPEWEQLTHLYIRTTGKYGTEVIKRGEKQRRQFTTARECVQYYVDNFRQIEALSEPPLGAADS